MKKVLGFSALVYDRSYLEKLTDTQKNELYLKDCDDCDNAICYYFIEEFLDELNDDCVDTEGYWFFAVEID